MPSFVVEQDRWGYFRIVDTRSDTRAAYSPRQARAEEIVARLNAELDGPPGDRTVRIPETEPAVPA